MQKRSLSLADVKLFKLDYSRVVENLRRYVEKALENGAGTVIIVESPA